MPKPKSLKRKRGDKGEVDYEGLQRSVDELDLKSDTIKCFSDLPLSEPTRRGIEATHFKNLTDIQAKSIPLALKKKDILGAAKTGSGKTLAFLVPVLENLYRAKWTSMDGLGALIISPTRELAIQIFEVLHKIGRYHHDLSAGLLIGGRNLREEQERLFKLNILVCTPGRMLQHMDQTAQFEVNNLQMLVLDEADRIMDMGFKVAVDAIVEHLPRDRQTMLFSATQTKKVSDLARLSLKDPEYVAVHEAASSATPTTLAQYYCIVPLAEKLNTLYSFIKGNLKAKIIVFLSCTKQVRFVYESFRHLQPGIPLMLLHGQQKQATRLDVTSKFTASKNSCVFATDVAARGLDFPAVDWVIQVDCPEDADTYIHRVGRTARNERDGKAVLFLDPSEEAILKTLEHKKASPQLTKPRQKKQQSVTAQLSNMCLLDHELKYLGQKAFLNYAKSIYIKGDKEVFDINNYDLEAFAASMGLPGAPRIKFTKGSDSKAAKNAPRALISDDEDSDKDADGKKEKQKMTKYDRLFQRRNQDILSGHYSKMIAGEDNGLDDADEDDDFLTKKRDLSMSPESEDAAETGPAAKDIPGVGRAPIVVDSARKEKMLKSKKALLKLKEKGKHMTFDEEGAPRARDEVIQEEEWLQQGAPEDQKAKFLEEERAKVLEADLQDKELAKAKKRAKREKRKAREAAERDGIVGGEEGPEVANGEEDPMALLASLPVAGEDDEDEDEIPAAKRSKRRAVVEEEPDTLEELEELAAGLLA